MKIRNGVSEKPLKTEKLLIILVDLLDCGVTVEEFCDLLGVEAVLLHTDLKSLKTTENEECAERIHNLTGHILKTEHTDLGAELGRANDESRNDITVTVAIGYFRIVRNHYQPCFP